MQTILLLIGMTLAVPSSSGEVPRVDGVAIYGRVGSVPIAEIREALGSLETSEKPASLEVVDATHIRAHLNNPDLGWVRIDRVTAVEPDGSKHPCWSAGGHVVEDIPAALQLIRTAEYVYVFPLPDPTHPHRDDAHMRLLNPIASSRIAGLLGDRNHWFQGFDDTIDRHPATPDIGLLFRRGRSEVVLFFEYQRAFGTFNGENTEGSLDFKWLGEMKDWERQFAQPEKIGAR